MRRKTTLSTHVLLAVGLVVNACFMLRNGEPGRPEWWPLALGFFAWTAAPFVTVAVMNVFLAGTPTGRIALLLTALAIMAGGLYALVQAFIIHLDAQSGIVLIFLPIYQWVVVVVGSVTAIVAWALARRRSPASHTSRQGHSGSDTFRR